MLADFIADTSRTDVALLAQEGEWWDLRELVRHDCIARSVVTKRLNEWLRATLGRDVPVIPQSQCADALRDIARDAEDLVDEVLGGYDGGWDCHKDVLDCAANGDIAMRTEANASFEVLLYEVCGDVVCSGPLAEIARDYWVRHRAAETERRAREIRENSCPTDDQRASSL